MRAAPFVPSVPVFAVALRALATSLRALATPFRALPPVALAALLAACGQLQPAGPIAAPETAQREAEAGERRVDPSQPAQAALLLPQTTSDAYTQAEAAEVLEAARIAERESGGLIDLRVYDTGGTEAGAVAAARRAAAEGADVILGPLRRDTTQAVRPIAEEAGLTVLSLSSDSAIAGPPVFLLGDLPENEVDRILGYAAARGVDRVGVVRPQDDYGAVVERAVREAAPRYGMTVTGALSYERSFDGVQNAVAAGADGLRAGDPDAILIAEGDVPLRTVASFLSYHDIIQPQTRYLGTAFWKGPETSREALLRGGWFAAPDPTAQEGFASAFAAATGQQPGPRAALGYDAARAAAELVRSGRATGSTTPFAPGEIARAGTFPGAAGPFRLTAEGGNRRALTVYEVTAGGFQPLDRGDLVGAGS